MQPWIKQIFLINVQVCLGVIALSPYGKMVFFPRQIYGFDIRSCTDTKYSSYLLQDPRFEYRNSRIKLGTGSLHFVLSPTVLLSKVLNKSWTL
jgi:hypothetical protein